MDSRSTAQGVYLVVSALHKFLLKKNERYGNSALEPVRIFCKTEAGSQLDSRIDDKLSRIKNSKTLRKNDTVDLLGYLVLKCVEQGWTDFSDLID